LAIAKAPFIAHVIFRLDVGGLENGLVNLINRLPVDDFRHAIICIDRSTDFANRIKRNDVEIVEIRKRPGFDLSALWRLYKTIRALKPDILHTRNLAALDALLPSMLAGVRYRIHGEHGWDVNDLAGTNRKLKWLRKLHSPLITRYVTVSRHLSEYLVNNVGIDSKRINNICNGVDIDRFRPNSDKVQTRKALHSVYNEATLVFGSVGRMQPVKGHIDLVEAFARCAAESDQFRQYARLVIVGEGSMRDAIIERIEKAGIGELCWLPGHRDDVPEIMASYDVYVQPSLAEGISNTILEAMACGLPVIATRVGGNSELVLQDTVGSLVPSADRGALASTLEEYAADTNKIGYQGAAARARVEEMFDFATMIDKYARLYRETIDETV